MRITQSMLAGNLMTNLNHNLQRMHRYQEQLNTQRRINRPSDDPVGIHYSLRYRSELRANAQYQENRDQALAWLEATESLMHSVNDIMHRAKDLAIQGANGTNPDSARESMAMEVEQLFDELLSIANERFQGRYVFNGEKTNEEPYDPDALRELLDGNGGSENDINIDDGKIMLQIAPGVEMAINVTGDEVFGDVMSEDDDDLFRIMADLASALRSGETDKIDGVIGRLEERSNDFLETMASVGARSKRIELTTERLENDKYNFTNLLSRTEDVNLPDAITQLKMAENVYIASLSVGARIIQPSLVDFLRG